MHSSTASSSSPDLRSLQGHSFFMEPPPVTEHGHKLEREITVRIVDTFWPERWKTHTQGLYLIKRSTLFLSAAAIDMQAALHIVLHDNLLSEVRCCNNLMNMEISRRKKKLTLGGKVSRSLKMSAQQQTRQTKNPEGRDAWTLTVQIVCVQLQLYT